MEFETMHLPAARDDVAPDGFDVRVLLRLERGSMAHFELGPGEASGAVSHRTVDEIWFVLSGNGEMWRQQGEREEVVRLVAGDCLSIPVGTRFQCRCLGDKSLAVIGVTMPAWPGPHEAYAVSGRWPRTV